MRICLIGPSYPFRGGITHYTTLLYRHLRLRHETAFFSFSRQYPKWLFPGKSDRDNSQIALKEEGVEAILDSMNPWSWYVTYKKIKAYRPELVIFPWWVFFWTPQFSFLTSLIRRNTKTRILFICHNVVEHESRLIARWCTKFVLQRGNLFIVHSKEDLQNLKKMFPQTKVRQTYHPSYDEFPRSGLSKESARRLLGVEGNIILFFGFVRPYKGLDYLLEALPRILSEQKVTLLVVGEFWTDKERYLQKIHILGLDGAIRIIDAYVPNEEIERYFVAADLLVMPYTSATGSGVVQLSFGFDLPVLVTAVGALPEVVADGVTGFVVPPRDPKAIAEKTVAFFKNGLTDAFAKNIEKEKHRFTWVNVVETIEELAAS
jgi:glycosyltransferase involved in cell wall biosynthesis